MYKFSKILVGLDQSDMDFELINGACKMCQLSGSKEVYFVNLIRDFQLPGEIQKQFPDLLEKAVDERKENIKREVERSFECLDVKTEFLVKKGQATKEIMRFVAEYDIDLIILGRKNEKKGGGVLINRLARRASCSLFVIPKGTKLDFNKMLVPSDFSDYSMLALEKAIEFSDKLDSKPKITVQNVYQVPSGYHYTGKTFNEFAEVMRQNATKDFEKFSGDLDLSSSNVETIYTLDRTDDVIGYIYEEARNETSNIIIIGAKGRTAATALFIGSKAETLINIDSKIPILVVRPKGKTAGILEYLQEI